MTIDVLTVLLYFVIIMLSLSSLSSSLSSSYRVFHRINSSRLYHSRIIVSHEYNNDNNLIVNSSYGDDNGSSSGSSIVSSYDEKSSIQSNPTPKELLYTALSSCTIMTMRTYYNNCKKGNASTLWSSGILNDIQVRVVEDNDANHHVPKSIDIYIKLIGTLTTEQRKRLLIIANQCPVKQMINTNINTHIE